MVKDIEMNNNNNKTILLVTNNIQHYQQQFNDYNINNYKISFANWNNILTLTTNNNNKNHSAYLKDQGFIILDISTMAVEDGNERTLTTIIEEIKKILPNKRIFFILSSESKIKSFLSLGICKQENIRLQPFTVFDLVDLIFIINKKDKLERLQLHDHCIHGYPSTDDKIKDVIKFLKIGIENNEATLILLDKDIDLSDFKFQLALQNVDINKLEKEGFLNIAYSEDWYLSSNQKNNMATIDNEKVYTKFFNLLERVTKKEGKKGLRIFGMMDCFFEYGLVDEIVDYDCMMPPKFKKPILSICVYSDKYIEQLSENHMRKLVLTHSKVWI